MKKITHLLSSLFLLGITITSNAQISTSTGGASNVLANSPTTNTNVGIGTNAPVAKLDIACGLPDGQVFSSLTERNAKSHVFSAGSIVNSTIGYRLINFSDFPVSNFDPKSVFWFSIDDRSDNQRFRVSAVTGGSGAFVLSDKTQTEYLKIYEDGNSNVFMHFPKPNSRIVIGGFGDYLPEHKFVVRGSAKIEGNILTDANIGIGTSNFVDGADTYRLSVNGAIRASRVKVYTTWADYVFEKEYQLPTLKEVENHIVQKGHLKDIPSAKEVAENGIELGEMNKLLLQKVEELTLYLIEMNKEMQLMKEQIKK